LASDLERSLGELAEQGEQTITAALDSNRYVALQRLLDQLLEHPPLTRHADRPAHTELPKSLAKAVRRLNKRLTTAETLPEGTERDEALHEARKTDKQVRYMTEILIPIIGKPARRLHKHTKKLQNLLGEYQDAVTARPILKQLAHTAHNNGHNAFTYGLLYAIEHNRMQHALTQLPNHLQQLRNPKTLTWLTPTQHTLPTIPRHEWTPAGPPVRPPRLRRGPAGHRARRVRQAPGVLRRRADRRRGGIPAMRRLPPRGVRPMEGAKGRCPDPAGRGASCPRRAPRA